MMFIPIHKIGKYPNPSVNQTGKILRFCVKISADAKASEPAGYLNRCGEGKI